MDEKNTLSVTAAVSENAHNWRFSNSSPKFKRVSIRFYFVFLNAVFCSCFFASFFIHAINSQVYRNVFWMKKIRYPLPRPFPKIRTIDGLAFHLSSSNVYNFGYIWYFLMQSSAVVSSFLSLYMSYSQVYRFFYYTKKKIATRYRGRAENMHKWRFE